MGAGLLTFPVVALAALLAQDAQVVRDGQFWVRTENGVARAAQARVLKISTRGAIVVRGADIDQVEYRLIERVRARNKDDAHRAFGSTISSTSAPGATIRLVIMPIARESVTTRLEVSVPRRLATVLIDTQLGDVEAYDLDGNLHAGTTAGQIRCDRIRGFVEGNTGGGEIHIGRAGGAVRCISAAGNIIVDSAGAEANCQTAGGEIQIGQAAGPLVLSTEGGNIQVERAASTVEAHTGQGVIEVARAGGMVYADTRGGSIHVGSARGVTGQSGQGPIRVKTLSGPLRLETGMGSILAELLAGARLEDSSLIAGSGDITLVIPSNLALSVVARNETGADPRIVSDFSEVRPKTVTFARPALVYEGSINGGGPRMSLDTGGGIIYVRRLK